jgi:hypothetical protein
VGYADTIQAVTPVRCVREREGREKGSKRRAVAHRGKIIFLRVF